MPDAAHRLATAADLASLGDAPAEVIHGVVTYRAEPSAEHADAQPGLGAFVRQHFHRATGRGGPGGWRVLTEVHVELETHEVYRPDVAGWRRERVPERPTGRPVTVRPDFICEILSESNAATDQVDKFRVYASSGVPFYWIADPTRKILTVSPENPLIWAFTGRSEERKVFKDSGCSGVSRRKPFRRAVTLKSTSRPTGGRERRRQVMTCAS